MEKKAVVTKLLIGSVCSMCWAVFIIHFVFNGSLKLNQPIKLSNQLRYNDDDGVDEDDVDNGEIAREKKVFGIV